VADTLTQTRVSFSLTVMSPHPIDELNGYLARDFAARAHDDYLYGIYKDAFDEPDETDRADQLHTMAVQALDLLEATGVSPSELQHPDVRVRAFYTFDPGSETIRAEVVRRLARINATIWVDANS